MRHSFFDHLSYVKWGFGVRGGRWLIAPSELVVSFAIFMSFFFTLRVAYIEKKRRSFFLAFVLLCFNYDSFIHFFLFVFFTIVSAEQDWAVTLGFFYFV